MNAINPQRLIDLIDDLLRQGEVSWVEFKRDYADPDMIGVRLSAIANAARLAGQHTGYVLWGIEDGSRAVVGTNIDPDTQKVGNQVFPFWLAQQLVPSIAFDFRTVQHPSGRLGHPQR